MMSALLFWVLFGLGLLAILFPVYLLLFAISGLRYEHPRFPTPRFHRKLAVLIPAYREDTVILETARTALHQDYPSDRFDVIVIADGLRMDTIKRLVQLPVRVIPVEFRKSTKVKALRAAVQQLADDGYDAITILDADNLMQPGFLNRANGALEAGFRVIQGLRAPKNEQGAFARLDGITEGFNTNIFRRGHQVLGLPSALTGSGMTFEWSLFEKFIMASEAIGGFDKELELTLTRRGESILYDEAAVVLDEKVSSSANLARQRSRWMGAQWHYARLHVCSAFHLLVKERNVAYADKAFQMILPPRVLLLAGTASMVPLSFLIAGPLASLPWLLAFLGTVAALLISLPAAHGRIRFADLLALPLVLFSYLIGLMRSVRANRSFVHTTHHASNQSS